MVFMKELIKNPWVLFKATIPSFVISTFENRGTYEIGVLVLWCFENFDYEPWELP
jgi:hypothetical protein